MSHVRRAEYLQIIRFVWVVSFLFLIISEQLCLLAGVIQERMQSAILIQSGHRVWDEGHLERKESLYPVSHHCESQSFMF